MIELTGCPKCGHEFWKLDGVDTETGEALVLKCARCGHEVWYHLEYGQIWLLSGKAP